MLLETEERNDREEELLLHVLSIPEFQCEKLNHPLSNTPIFLFLISKSLIKNSLKSRGIFSLTSVVYSSSCECLTSGCFVPFR